MKRKTYLLLILLLVFSFNYTHANDDFSAHLEHNLECMVDNISEPSELNEPKAPVRRIWYETTIYVPGNAPSYFYYEYNGFRGYLSLGYQIGGDEFGGGYYYYSGYLYHPDYPYPEPSKLNEEMS